MPIKKSNKQHRSDLLYFAGRLSLELNRLDDRLKPYRKMDRHIHYRYIGDDEPSTGRATPMTNPELFEAHDGYPTLFDGFVTLVEDIYTTVEEMDDGQSGDV
jgi:hypothetical protein